MTPEEIADRYVQTGAQLLAIAERMQLLATDLATTDPLSPAGAELRREIETLVCAAEGLR
jgi:hypothetical protein